VALVQNGTFVCAEKCGARQNALEASRNIITQAFGKIYLVGAWFLDCICLKIEELIEMGRSKPARSSRDTFAALQPKTLNISQRIIRKKWQTLPDSSQSKVRQIFRSVQKSVQDQDRKGNRRFEVQGAIDAVLTT